MMTKQTVKEYLLENVDLMALVNEMNSWDGSFENLCFYENDAEFFNTFFDGNVFEAVRSTYYGGYNFADDYVFFNGYGNVESANGWKVEEMLKDSIDDILDVLIEEYYHLYIDDELKDMLEELENEGE